MDVLQDAEHARARSSRRTLDDARNDVFLRTNVGKDIARRRRRRRSAATSPRTIRCRRRRSGARACSRDIPLDEVFDAARPRRAVSPAVGRRAARAPQYEATVQERVRADARAPEGGREARRLAQAAGGVRLLPRAVAAATTLIVYDPDGVRERRRRTREIARFHFPRQEGRERLCLADYFRSVESGDVDVVALQIVTVGDEATRALRGAAGGGRVHRGVLRRTASRSRPRRRSPSGCTARMRRELGIPAGAASATRGATARVPISRITRSCSSSSRRRRRSAWS